MTAVPFVIGQWVRGERFYGRRRLLAEILDGPRNGLWLLGTRRVGKTSLLKQLEHLAVSEPERGYFPLFWDLQGADDPDELHAGFNDALLDAEERLAAIDVDPEELEADDLFAAMSRLRRRLRRQQLRLLLLCDEVEELIKLNQKDPALLGKLRRAMQSSEGVRAVLASTIRLWSLADQRGDTSPFLHGFLPPLPIGMMSDEGAEALIRQSRLPEEERPPFDDEAVETIRRRCDCHPYLLQLVCKRLQESGDLERAVEEVATDQMVAYFFSVDFEMLSPVERQLLRTLAHDTPAASDTLEARLALDAPALRSSLQNLENLGFIRRDAEQHVVLANYFFRRWLTDLTPVAGTAGRQSSTAPLDIQAAPTLRRTAAGTLLDDRYELRRKAGEGATGFVYEAWDRLLGTRIAVKLLRREYAGNSLVLERFRQEILLSRNLGHPNILRAYHLGRFEDRAYLTMQWIDGPTLAATIADEAPLATERVAFLGSRLASALAAAHSHNVLHRDVKPQNVLLGRGGEPLITDFGLARLLEGPGVTTAGVFLGTPNYVSPEQSRLEPLDARSDVYSLGVVLFEMATGRCPFRGNSAGEVLEMHRDLAPPDPRAVAHELSPELAEIVLACLEKDREARIPSASELGRRLEELLPEGRAERPAQPVVTSIGDAEPPRSESTPGTDTGAAGHQVSAEELIPLVYDELRRLARGFLARERPDHTLQPTALVHEAYMRLANQQAVNWAGRTHFFAVGANVMRRLLIDHARTRGRQKRGGDMRKVTLQEAITPGGRELDFDELLSLDAALTELAAEKPRQAAIVELRFFGGMTVAEVAEQLSVSKRTVEADWSAARDWLRRRLAEDPGTAPPA